MRRLVKIVAAGVAILVIYFGVTFVQVWMASRRDQVTPTQAILVFGAAQYNGRPSPVLRARLDHAVDLYHDGVAPRVVVTGGRRPGDTSTEASVGAQYILGRGVPESAILRETGGRNSWESLAAAARFLKQRDITRVVLVSDPFHSARVAAMADELGLDATVSPTRTSPIGGLEEVRHLGKETILVGTGRIVGFRRLMRVQEQVQTRN